MEVQMVDMKREEEKEPSAVMSSGSSEPYPYGLCITLEDDDLEKLGITEMPRIGQEYHLMACGKVTSLRQYGEDGENCMAIQITMMTLKPKAQTPMIEQKPRTVSVALDGD